MMASKAGSIVGTTSLTDLFLRRHRLEIRLTEDALSSMGSSLGLSFLFGGRNCPFIES